MNEFKKDYSKYLIQLSSIVIIFAVWFIISHFGLINPLFIPNIQDTFSSIFEYFQSFDFYKSLFLTTYRALFGLFISIIIGVPAGLILGKYVKIFKFFEMPIEFFRAIPSSALFPLFILFFGIGDASKIGVVVYACSLIILINSFYGALPNQEKLDRINMMKTLKATNFQIFTKVIIRDALPNISAGIRVSLSFAFALVVVTEMFLGANDGLGKLIYDMYLQYRVPEMYGAIIILGLTGFLINQLYLKVEKHFLFWN